MKPTKVQVEVGKSAATLTIPIPSLRYINRFMRSNSAVDILQLGVFPDAKEISESFAAVNALERKLGLSKALMTKLNPYILVVGDGCTPRTGVLLAFYTPYDIISIDPEMRKTEWPEVQRLEVFQTRLRDFEYDFDRPIIMIGVHSHVPSKELLEFYDKVGDKLMAIIENPCCYPSYFPAAFGPPVHEYTDWGIHSPKRDIRIWKFRQKNTHPLLPNMLEDLI